MVDTSCHTSGLVEIKKIKVPRIKRVNPKILPEAFYVDQPKANRKQLFKMAVGTPAEQSLPDLNQGISPLG